MGSKVMILGAAYKKNIDDMRGSPAVEIIEILLRKGALVSYNDPYVPSIPEMRGHKLELESTEITKEVLIEQDVVIVVTNHSSYDFEFIKRHANLIVDTRGVYRDLDQKIVRG